MHDLPPYIYAWNWWYAVFGYHGYQYTNELKFTNLCLFYISNNCWKFGNDLFNGCRDMGIHNYRPAYLPALVFTFMFLNLPHCDGLKRLNTTEPQYHLYIGGSGFPLAFAMSPLANQTKNWRNGICIFSPIWRNQINDKSNPMAKHSHCFH